MNIVYRDSTDPISVRGWVSHKGLPRSVATRATLLTEELLGSLKQNVIVVIIVIIVDAIIDL